MREHDISIYETHAASWWDGSTPWMRQLGKLVPARFSYFDRVLDDWRGKEVLDLGCGGGFMAEGLAGRGASVTGVDPSGRSLEAARRHAAADGLAIDYRHGFGEDIPLDAGSVDVVVCVDTLEHVDDLARVVAEVRRVLKPGGLFLFDTINRTALASIVVVGMAERVLGLLPRGTHEPDKFIKPAELRRLLISSGFRAPSIAGFGPRGLDRQLDFRFGWLPTTAVMYIGHASLP